LKHYIIIFDHPLIGKAEIAMIPGYDVIQNLGCTTFLAYLFLLFDYNSLIMTYLDVPYGSQNSAFMSIIMTIRKQRMSLVLKDKGRSYILYEKKDFWMSVIYKASVASHI